MRLSFKEYLITSSTHYCRYQPSCSGTRASMWSGNLVCQKIIQAAVAAGSAFCLLSRKAKAKRQHDNPQYAVAWLASDMDVDPSDSHPDTEEDCADSGLMTAARPKRTLVVCGIRPQPSPSRPPLHTTSLDCHTPPRCTSLAHTPLHTPLSAARDALLPSATLEHGRGDARICVDVREPCMPDMHAAPPSLVSLPTSEKLRHACMRGAAGSRDSAQGGTAGGDCGCCSPTSLSSKFRGCAARPEASPMNAWMTGKACRGFRRALL